MKSINRVIHYCWFGGKPLPSLAIKCIESWKKYLPDYEIKRWDESNFDVNIVPYTSQAYKEKKYAFVSDYARFWILYHYGGLYFDTDVEILKPIDELIKNGPFMGCENSYRKGQQPYSLGVAPGLGIGTYSGHPFYREILALYESTVFKMQDGGLNLETVVQYTTDLMCQKGLKNTPDIQCIDGIYVYPKEYLCPQNYKTGKIEITENTYTIHYYAASWVGWQQKVKQNAYNLLIALVGIDNYKRIRRFL